ncbi:MAG: D-tyrosyl-tRNA(Tyr) deacylase [Clostridia bacterium]|nr:D-tyrosyl-tRNA(Tyr) deacylase [Clostridia bacterium]
MRIVIQRVVSSRLEVEGRLVSEIGKGYNVFVGVMETDTLENMKRVARRIATVRLFREDESDKLTNNISQVGGEILLVSNFTLCDKKGSGGARPDFTISAKKDKANELYLALQKELIEVYNIPTKLGEFGEDMQIYCQLDGPLNLVQEY